MLNACSFHGKLETSSITRNSFLEVHQYHHSHLSHLTIIFILKIIILIKKEEEIQSRSQNNRAKSGARHPRKRTLQENHPQEITWIYWQFPKTNLDAPFHTNISAHNWLWHVFPSATIWHLGPKRLKSTTSWLQNIGLSTVLEVLVKSFLKVQKVKIMWGLERL